MSDSGQIETKYEVGSGNVFADLVLDDADELYARAQLGFHIHKLLSDRELKEREIESLLGIKQPEVSHLLNGHFSRFTTDILLDFLKRLDQTVSIRSRSASSRSVIEIPSRIFDFLSIQNDVMHSWLLAA